MPRQWAGALASGLVVAGCAKEPGGPPPVPDTLAPRLSVSFPTGSWPSSPHSAWDRDSNGLLDLELAWRDSSGAVDPHTLRIVCLEGIAGAPPDTNLALGWRRVRLDSAGAALEETIPLLLSSAASRLVISVRDTAGNTATDTVVVGVPPGSFHRTIDLAYRPEWQQVVAANLVLTLDGRKGVVPFTDGHVAIFDPDGVAPTHYVDGVFNTIFASDIALDSATGLAYIGGGGGRTPGITVFDTRAEQQVRTRSVGLGVASVEVHGDRIYVGEACTTGRIIVLDKSSLNEVGRIDPQLPYPRNPCNNSDAEVVTADGRTGWAKVVEQGVFSFDPQTFRVIRRYDVEPPDGDGYYGDVRDLKLLAERWLYMAKLDGGLDEFDTQSDRVANHYPTSGRVPNIKELALSPDGTRLFVSADTSVSGPVNVRAPLLFEVPGLRLRYTFPPRGGRIGDAVVWHPDGRRVYMMAEFNVDVYVVRP